MLTKESAPWVLDGKIHDNAAEELSAETQAKILVASTAQQRHIPGIDTGTRAGS